MVASLTDGHTDTQGDLQLDAETLRKKALLLKLAEYRLKHGKFGIIGENAEMENTVFRAIRRVRTSSAPVYIAGESGTGKELVARALHDYGSRQSNPFVAVNVTEFTENLLEAELFGVEAKVATGVQKREGLFVQAHTGTLFLDEVAEMSTAMQVKLLRVLQESSVVRVGGNRSKPVDYDVRLIAASSRPLKDYVRAGTFRDDLYYRLNVVHIKVPPLRDRGADIALLAEYFRQKYCIEKDRDVTFGKTAYEWFVAESWPGNVRELESAIRGAIAWTQKGTLEKKDFYGYKEHLGSSSYHRMMSDPTATLEAITKATIEARLQHTGGNVTAAAKNLGMTFRQLRYQIKKLGIDMIPYRQTQ